MASHHQQDASSDPGGKRTKFSPPLPNPPRRILKHKRPVQLPRFRDFRAAVPGSSRGILQQGNWRDTFHNLQRLANGHERRHQAAQQAEQKGRRLYPNLQRPKAFQDNRYGIQFLEYAPQNEYRKRHSAEKRPANANQRFQYHHTPHLTMGHPQCIQTSQHLHSLFQRDEKAVFQKESRKKSHQQCNQLCRPMDQRCSNTIRRNNHTMVQRLHPEHGAAD